MEIITEAINTTDRTVLYVMEEVEKIKKSEADDGEINLSLDLTRPESIRVEVVCTQSDLLFLVLTHMKGRHLLDHVKVEYDNEAMLRSGIMELLDLTPEVEWDKSDGTCAVSDGYIRVDWVDLNEGYNGEYDPKDPKDEPLLRFDISLNTEGQMDVVESRCTAMSKNASKDVLAKSVLWIYQSIRAIALKALPGCPDYSKEADELSDINEGWFSPLAVFINENGIKKISEEFLRFSSVAISFDHDDVTLDETEFDVENVWEDSGRKELITLFDDFCKEEGLSHVTILNVRITNEAETQEDLLKNEVG